RLLSRIALDFQDVITLPADVQPSGNVQQAAGAVRLAGAFSLRIPRERDLSAFIAERDADVIAPGRRRHAPAPVFGDHRDPVAGDVVWRRGSGRRLRGEARGGQNHQTCQLERMLRHAREYTTKSRQSAVVSRESNWRSVRLKRPDRSSPGGAVPGAIRVTP